MIQAFNELDQESNINNNSLSQLRQDGKMDNIDDDFFLSEN